MLLRSIRGTVVAGRETDFVAACRQQVAERGRAQGLVSFFAGYRRIEGLDRFVLAAVWDTEADAVQSAGDAQTPTVVDILDGIAHIESFDVYSTILPPFRGIVDAPGGVVRVTTARVSFDARERMLSWLRNPSRGRTANVQRLMLGWALGERQLPDEDAMEVLAVSAWPSPLVIEAIADPGRKGEPIYTDVDEFASDSHVEQFQAIGLELPDVMSDLGSRRVICARFGTREAADDAAAALTAAVASPGEANISVAPLGAPGTASDVRAFIVVARVAINEYVRAERLIADRDGEVILAQAEERATLEHAAGGGLEPASFAPQTLSPRYSPAG